MNIRNKGIKKFIEKYSNILKALEMDIAHSELEDRWFLFKYNPIFSSRYEFFIEIESVEHLVDCVLSEFSYEMHVELGIDDVDTPECEKNNISEMIEAYQKRDSIPTLAAILAYLKGHDMEKDSELLKCLMKL